MMNSNKKNLNTSKPLDDLKNIWMIYCNNSNLISNSHGFIDWQFFKYFYLLVKFLFLKRVKEKNFATARRCKDD